MEKVDFSQEQVLIKLPNPIFYVDPKKREQAIIDTVEISRLNTPQLNSFKAKMNQVTAKMGSLSFMIPFFQILCKTGIVRFYSDSMPIAVHDKDQVTDLLPFESAYKVALFILMHLRETSHLAGSYRCKKCSGTNMFDIDPEIDIPSDVEPGRGYQFDYLEFCTEVTNHEKNQYFTHKLSKPVSIDVPKDPKAQTIEWIRAEVDFLKFSYPTIKTYSDIAQNPDRALSSDYYALYEVLVEIADFDRLATSKIKLKNTVNKIFNFKNKEFNEILKTYQEFSFTNEFFYDCLRCGATNEDVFDMTNFFESLKS
jgi:DNA-directed RNA polymerase subunit RPC12/RpoP